MTRPSGARFAAVGVLREVLAQPRLLGDLVEGLELVGLRLVRPEDAEVLHVQPHDLAQEVAEDGTLPARVAPGFSTSTAEVRKSGMSRACATGRHWRPGWRSSAGSPSGPAPSTRGSAAPPRRRASPACSCAAIFPAAAIGQGWWRRPEAGSGGRARSLRGSARPPLAGPSSPWGCAG